MQKQMCCWLSLVFLAAPVGAQELNWPGVKPLKINGDPASKLVNGVDRFLLRKIAGAKKSRQQKWQRDFSSPDAYNKSVSDNRRTLAHILGVRDQRIQNSAPTVQTVPGRNKPLARTDGYQVYAVRWPVLADPDPRRKTAIVYGEGLLVVPHNEDDIVANVICVPDADHTPEQILGLSKGVDVENQFARKLANSGCRVLIPTLISRKIVQRNGRSKLSNREFVYRASFVLGRHVIGYEMQKILAGVEWFAKISSKPIGVVGHGEGGMLALFTAAVDLRIQSVCSLGYFGPREQCWTEPLSRNVFNLLNEFGAADIASLILPRPLFIDCRRMPVVELSGKHGGGPARLQQATTAECKVELQQLQRLIVDGKPKHSGKPNEQWIPTVLLPDAGADANPVDDLIANLGGTVRNDAAMPKAGIPLPDASERENRQIEELDRFNQLLLRESPFVRNEFMKQLDTSSLPAYEKSVEKYRTIFRDDVIGRFRDKLLPPNARARKLYEHEKWVGYAVELDVFDDVIAYGVLLLPRDLKPGEKRPVVVCQHGLEGRPTDTFQKDHPAYHDFAGKLAERGFITFAPQNLYLFRDRFRTLQRKANPLGKTLFSVIVPQHQQIVNWLKAQPNVDPDRIAFYGLSYGGKSAMRIPALVTDYCLSICSADFNEWVRKNASTRHNFSYVWTGEYEIFEWDLGSTFNYSEMAALIAPRPFMVERGHFDGVGKDEWVAYEYAKVRHLYAAKLGIPNRTEIEWFRGPHTIYGQGTFQFLQRHLKWPQQN